MPRETAGAANGRFRTPWGEGLVTVRRGRLVGVELPPILGVEAPELDKTAGPQDLALAARWVSELEAYFRGERLTWIAEEIGLDRQQMSPFLVSVYETLLTVPAGITVSYGTLADMAGFPRAARAVGTAMARNYIPIVVPCHRVIRSDGTLGRYGSDSSWKERLLAHEREHMAEGDIWR
jgi:methylated-DNA-[protein]-cysteine S-methyltransferase